MGQRPTLDERPIDVAALAIAQTLDPRASPDDARQRLDALAAKAREVGIRNALAEFRGDREDYYSPENSLLPRVLIKRRGLPLTLSVVWMGVGRRIGLPVQGVGFPGHFLARVEGELLDPFAGGTPIGDAELAELATRFLGHEDLLEPEMLQPVPDASIAIRMLTNLRNAYIKRGDHGHALLVCDQLVERTGAAVARRDRGLHALALGAHTAAAEDLRAYLDAKPDARDRAQVEAALLRCERSVTLH